MDGGLTDRQTDRQASRWTVRYLVLNANTATSLLSRHKGRRKKTKRKGRKGK